MSLARRLIAILTLLSLASLGSASAAPGDGFLGAVWGASKEKVLETLSARPGGKFDEAKGNSELWFSGGEFAGMPVLKIVANLEHDKLVQGDIILVQSGGSLETQFQNVKKMIADKYGPPISEGVRKDDLRAVWNFPAPGEKEPNQLSVFVDDRRWKIGWGVTLRCTSSAVVARKKAAKSGL